MMIRTTFSGLAVLGSLWLVEKSSSGHEPERALNPPVLSRDTSPTERSANPAPGIDNQFPTAGITTGPTAESSAQLTPELEILRDQVQACLQHYYKPENAAQRSPWAVMHSLIAYGVDTQLYAAGRQVNAIGWLGWNGTCRGQQLLGVSNGRIFARQGPGLQGHEGQFLAMLAQSRVKADFPLKVGQADFTVADLIESEKWTCRSQTELTFKLTALAHYLESDATWKNQQGETWDISRLIREELAQDVSAGACGGTHRMMGFSYAVRTRQRRGEKLDGQWLRAKKFVDEYHEYTLALQNADGSFSTQWFKGRGDWGDEARRLQTTGHILEWLVYSLPDDQLRDARVVKAVRYLTHLMHPQRHEWEIGPQGHALHALVTYDERVFGSKPGHRTLKMVSAEQILGDD